MKYLMFQIPRRESFLILWRVSILRMSFSYTSEKYFLKRKSVASEASYCLSNSAKKLIVVQCFLALKRFKKHVTFRHRRRTRKYKRMLEKQKISDRGSLQRRRNNVVLKGESKNVCTNLMVQVSRIHGHEIHVVSYAYLDGDCRLY